MTVEKSSYINQCNIFGNTLLHFCSINDNIKIARLLLENGVKLSPNKAGHSPISIWELREKFSSLVDRTLYCSEPVSKNDFFPGFSDSNEWKNVTKTSILLPRSALFLQSIKTCCFTFNLYPPNLSTHFCHLFTFHKISNFEKSAFIYQTQNQNLASHGNSSYQQSENNRTEPIPLSQPKW